MRVIIAGSRTINNYMLLCHAIRESKFVIDTVLSGHANGVDKLGEQWARLNNKELELYPADWSQGKGAGYARNYQMATKADALIALWDKTSRGTKHMIDTAKKKGLKVYVLEVEES